MMLSFWYFLFLCFTFLSSANPSFGSLEGSVAGIDSRDPETRTNTIPLPPSFLFPHLHPHPRAPGTILPSTSSAPMFSFAFFPVLAYSALLAVFGFISVRIAKWRQWTLARPTAALALEGEEDDDGVELLPTNTSTLSSHFKNLPIPPPLPSSPVPVHHARTRSFSNDQPGQPPVHDMPERDRPKSPLQIGLSSPGSRLKSKHRSHSWSSVSSPLSPSSRRNFTTANNHAATTTPNTPLPSQNQFVVGTLVDLSVPSHSPPPVHVPTTGLGWSSFHPLPPSSASHRGEINLIDLHAPEKDLKWTHHQHQFHLVPSTSPRPVPALVPVPVSITVREEKEEVPSVEKEVDIGWKWEEAEAFAEPRSSKLEQGQIELDLVDEKSGLPVTVDDVPFLPIPVTASSSMSTTIGGAGYLGQVRWDDPVMLPQPPISPHMTVPDAGHLPVAEVLEIDNFGDDVEQQQQPEASVVVIENVVGDEEYEAEEEDTCVIVDVDVDVDEKSNDVYDLDDLDDTNDICGDEEDGKDGWRKEVEGNLRDVEEAREGGNEDELTPPPLVSLADVEPVFESHDVDQVDTVVSDQGKEEEEEEFPDPDLLPLPELASGLDFVLEEPTSPGELAKELAPTQIPTPPASPPLQSRLLPVPVPSSPLPLLHLSPLPSPLPQQRRVLPAVLPAWSVRAADAPPLGLSSASLTSVSGPIRSKASMQHLKVDNEDQNGEDVPEGSLLLESESQVEVAREEEEEEEDQDQDQDQYEREDNEDEGRLLPESLEPPKTASILPGAFPVDAHPLAAEDIVEPRSSSSSPSSSPSLTSANVADPAASTVTATKEEPEPAAEETANTAIVKPTESNKPRRPARSPIDIALAMQLRPGLGLGADPAWMVRFLMAMFGWFIVLISGSEGVATGGGGGAGAGRGGGRIVVPYVGIRKSDR